MMVSVGPESNNQGNLGGRNIAGGEKKERWYRRDKK